MAEPARVRTSGATLDRHAARALAEGACGDPFAVLGPHDANGGHVIRAFLPGARAVEVLGRADRRLIGRLEGFEPSGFFEGRVESTEPYLLHIDWPGGVQETEDPYAFGPLLGDVDLYLFSEGRHFRLSSCLGAQHVTVDGVAGIRFAVWAPNARRVSVVGDFNAWDGRRHPMRLRHGAGVWEIFVPRLEAGQRYKYEIVGPDGARLPLKADPVALATERPPATASVVPSPKTHSWDDGAWMARRTERQRVDAPISIYEVHAGSWRRSGNWAAHPTWDDLARTLVPYAVDMGFTHVEFLPLTEHPFTGSWGYQPLSLFAPTSRFGEPEGFARLVDACHGAGLGVILDWVPAHFPSDPHGLGRFDGTALYEHLDSREGLHKDWNTFIYNFGRREVQGTLIASALHWLEAYHVDGLRVDAVASMLYRDYSREEGEWIPNIAGGRENLEAIGFLRHLNAVVGERCPGAVMIAEESTAWPGVSRPVHEGGLGFHYKWNMGWMHDTLRYIAHDPVHRRYHHNDFTFGLIYAFSENFILPLSHDEVVHGKASLIGKMPGDRWQRFANLRAYYGFMWGHPGKKLLFMGGEIAQRAEWNHDAEVEWHLTGDPLHEGVRLAVRDLNRLYRTEPSLHRRDCHPSGFRWIVGDDRTNSVFAFFRFGAEGDAPVLVVCNMTPVPRHNYRIGVPRAGRWREIFNSDSAIYGGSNVGNGGGVLSVPERHHGERQALDLVLPPLATVFLRFDE